MTYTELQARATLLASFEGWTDVSPAPDWGVLVNTALRQFSWIGEYNLEDTTVTTVAEQAEYALTTPPDWIRLTDVSYGTDTWLYQSDEAQQRRGNPLWMHATSGIPYCFWLTRPNRIRLHVKPSTASVTIYIRGYRAEPALSAGGDIPRAPLIYHEGIAKWAAALQGEVYMQGQSSQRVAHLLQEGHDMAADCRRYLSAQAQPALQRRVMREFPERLWIGSDRKEQV